MGVVVVLIWGQKDWQEVWDTQLMLQFDMEPSGWFLGMGEAI